MEKNKITLKAKEIIEKYQIRAPVDLNIILKGEDIELRKIDKSKINNDPHTQEVEGEIWAFLIPKNSFKFKNKKTTILYSSVIEYPNSIRFTIAHELGHYFLDGNHSDIVYRKKFVSDPKEYKYNEFAIKLLIPDQKEFRKNCQIMDKYELASYYGVPIAAIEILLQDWY